MGAYDSTIGPMQASYTLPFSVALRFICHFSSFCDFSKAAWHLCLSSSAAVPYLIFTPQKQEVEPRASTSLGH